MASVESLEAAESLCPSCREGETQLERGRSFGLYRDALRAAILLLKFQRRERWGVRLGTLLVATCDDLLAMSGADEAMLVPVPLHASRFRQRGYNQAELLCRGLLRADGHGSLKLEAGALKKTRATPQFPDLAGDRGVV
jgi:predicted amidophosphoribosyltransferase